MHDISSSYPFAINTREVLDYIVNNVNQQVMSITNDTLTVDYFDNNGESLQTLFQDATKLANIKGNNPYEYMAIVGPDYTRNSPFVQFMNLYSMLVVSSEMTGDLLSNKQVFPNFVRVTISDNYESLALAKFISSQGWKRVGILASADNYGSGLTQAFIHAPTTNPEINLNVVSSQSFQATDPKTIRQALQVLKENDARIIAVFATNVNGVFDIAQDLGMTTEEYVYLGTDGSSAYVYPLGSFWMNLWYNASYPATVKFQHDVAVLPNTTWGQYPTQGEYEPHLDDAIRLVAHSLVKLSKIDKACNSTASSNWCELYQLSNCANHNDTNLCIGLQQGCENGHSSILCPKLGSVVSERLLLIDLAFQTPFVGVTGPVVLDAHGNRAMPCAIVNQVLQLNFSDKQSNVSTAQIGVIDTNLNVTMTKSIVWPGHLSLAPLDHVGARPGSNLPFTRMGAIASLAWGNPVINMWVAVMLFENIMPNLKTYKHKNALKWSINCLLALVLGVWTSLTVGFTSVQISRLPSESATGVFSAKNMFASFTIPIPVLALGFGTIIYFLQQYNPYIIDEETAMTKTQKYVETAKKKIISSLIGAVTIVISSFLTHLAILFSIEAPVLIKLDAGFQILALVIGFTFGVPATWFFCFKSGTHFRFMAAALMASSIFFIQFISIEGTNFILAQNVSEPSELVVSAATIQTVATVLTILSTIVLIWSNLNYLKFSRDSIETFLRGEKSKVLSLENDLKMERAVILRDKIMWTVLKCLGPTMSLAHPVMKTIISEVSNPLPNYSLRFFEKRNGKLFSKVVSVDDIMNNRLAFEFIKYKLCERKVSENAQFIGDVHRFKRALESDKKETVKNILECYINDDGASLFSESKFEPINIDAQLRTKLIMSSSLVGNDVSSSFFNDALKEVYKLVRTNDLNAQTNEICAYLLEWSNMYETIIPNTVTADQLTIVDNGSQGSKEKSKASNGSHRDPVPSGATPFTLQIESKR